MVRINQNYCVGCNKWEWDITLVKDGAYYYHQICLDKLEAGVIHTDNTEMYKQLSKAFSHVRIKKEEAK